MKFPDYFHGSSSASLVYVLREGSQGLMSTGQLLSQGIAPYSGELGVGISKKGINQDSLSVSKLGCIRDVIDYALNYDLHVWTPEESEKAVEASNRRIAEESQKKYRAKYLKEHVKLTIEIEEMRIKIEEIRKRNWEHLSLLERQLISSPFPVIYGIEYKGTVVEVKSAMYDYGIKEPVGLDHLTVYVPEARVPFVAELAKGVCKKEMIFPFITLREILDQNHFCQDIIYKPLWRYEHPEEEQPQTPKPSNT
ncbi:MAG: hypothetical protein WCV90_00815 [Candidatus Woesearchaeota archaeon]|jgi:hypothetical protein